MNESRKVKTLALSVLLIYLEAIVLPIYNSLKRESGVGLALPLYSQQIGSQTKHTFDDC
jgi:hypothetical protein